MKGFVLMIKTINKLTIFGLIPLITGTIVIFIQPFNINLFFGIGLISFSWLWTTIMFLIKLTVTSKQNVSKTNEQLSTAELKQMYIDHYVNLLRIKKHQEETNPELEYQLRIYKNKLHALGVNTEEFEYE